VFAIGNDAAMVNPNLTTNSPDTILGCFVYQSLIYPRMDGKVAGVIANNPLVYGGQKLIPSVTRVFSRARDLYVFAQAYQRGQTSTQPLVAFVSFYRGDVKAFETTPLAVTEGLDPKTKAVPLRFSLPLESLTPGRYDCQLTVLDGTSNKVAFWRAPIVVVP